MINYSVKKKGFWERISITNKLIFITCLTSILAFILESIFGADSGICCRCASQQRRRLTGTSPLARRGNLDACAIPQWIIRLGAFGLLHQSSPSE